MSSATTHIEPLRFRPARSAVEVSGREEASFKNGEYTGLRYQRHAYDTHPPLYDRVRDSNTSRACDPYASRLEAHCGEAQAEEGQ